MRKYRLVRLYSNTPLIPARLLASAEGYAMVRRRGGGPFVVSEKRWHEAPPCDADGKPL